MSKMTTVHLGVIVFAICLSTMVVSQNNTTPMGGNVTTTPNTTTTMVTAVHNSTGNTTSPTGAGNSLHPGFFSLLSPAIVAAFLLHRLC